MNHTITTNLRLEELPPEHQLIIVRLVNHLASLPGSYQENACKRLEKISRENPWQDDIEGLEKFPIDDEDIKEAALSDKYMLEGDDNAYANHDYREGDGGI
jgi:Ran GTPase-activating protein (RanGAP) involved in mRNA processing and transport